MALPPLRKRESAKILGLVQPSRRARRGRSLRLASFLWFGL